MNFSNYEYLKSSVQKSKEELKIKRVFEFGSDYLWQNQRTHLLSCMRRGDELSGANKLQISIDCDENDEYFSS